MATTSKKIKISDLKSEAQGIGATIEKNPGTRSGYTVTLANDETYQVSKLAEIRAIFDQVHQDLQDTLSPQPESDALTVEAKKVTPAAEVREKPPEFATEGLTEQEMRIMNEPFMQRFEKSSNPGDVLFDAAPISQIAEQWGIKSTDLSTVIYNCARSGWSMKIVDKEKQLYKVTASFL